MEQRDISCISFPEKQKSTEFSNCNAVPGIFEKLMKCGEDNCICVKDCNLMILFLKCKLLS